jgi:diguanylate cyclase (GGDEF)-like protein
MAEIFENNIRKADVISRYGGEEFVIILPEIDAARAVIVAEKLRTVVENSNFPGTEKLPAGKITISIGVASFPQDGSAPAEVLNEADKALYMAKKMGRNRVVDSSLLKEMQMQ